MQYRALLKCTKMYKFKFVRGGLGIGGNPIIHVLFIYFYFFLECLCTHLFVCLFIYLFVYQLLFIYLFTYLFYTYFHIAISTFFCLFVS